MSTITTMHNGRIVRRRALTLAASTSMLLAGLVFGASVSSAYYQRSLIEPSFGTFAKPSGVAVDEASGNVFVADGEPNELVDVFGAAGGSPAGGYPTPLTGSFVFKKEPVGVAIDNSSSGAKGSIYVTNVKGSPQALDKFTLNGSHQYEEAGSPFPLVATREPVGAATDGEGNVYQSDYGAAAVREYMPAGAEVTSFVLPEGKPQGVAVDSTGDIYVQTYARHILFELKRSSDTSTTVTSTATLFSGGVVDIAVDRATGHVLVDLGSSVEELDASGKAIGGFGEGTLLGNKGAGGIAVNESTNTAYVVNQVFGGGQAFRFGPAVLVPDVSTEASTNVQAESVTLNGSINPDGLAATSKFEYGPTTEYGQSATAVQASGGPNPGSSDDGEGTSPVPVTANLTGLLPNQTYHYRLDGTNANGTNTTQGGDLTFTTPAILPTVNDKATTVSDITQTGVLLTGTVNPENSPTEYRFEYVTQAEYEPGAANPYEHGASTPLVSLAPIVGDDPAGPIHLPELVPGATYHYALVATNQAGTVTGQDGTFTLTPAAPVATTGAASVLSQTSVTLNGMLDTRGVPASYGFALATSPGQYGPAIVAGSASGVGAQAVSLAIAGLAPGTTYWYKLVASNGEGEGQGGEASFTTPGYPSLISSPSAAPLLATPAFAFPKETGGVVVKGKTLTRAQKLKNALKACKRKAKSKRAACEREARRRYGPKAKAKGKKK